MKKLLILASSIIAYKLVTKAFMKNKLQGNSPSENLDTESQSHPSTENTDKNNEVFCISDRLVVSGEYRWTFYLGPIKQVSAHIFAKNHIDYRMQGKAHSTEYRMHKVSYDAQQGKWIGKTDDDLVFVLFFKTDASKADVFKGQGNAKKTPDNKQITLFKHKCGYGKKGLAEAEAYACPPDDATADHGWNVYSKQGTNEPEDILPFAGKFISVDDERLVDIAPNQVVAFGKTYQKLTHHFGERRWVGQLVGKAIEQVADNSLKNSSNKISKNSPNNQGDNEKTDSLEYLVMFYELGNSLAQVTEKVTDPNATVDAVTDVSLALGRYQDIEAAYQSKHDQQSYQTYQLIKG